MSIRTGSKYIETEMSRILYLQPRPTAEGEEMNHSWNAWGNPALVSFFATYATRQSLKKLDLNKAPANSQLPLGN